MIPGFGDQAGSAVDGNFKRYRFALALLQAVEDDTSFALVTLYPVGAVDGVG
jgi:hypothetical protein